VFVLYLLIWANARAKNEKCQKINSVFDIYAKMYEKSKVKTLKNPITEGWSKQPNCQSEI
jgi:hypothetical protein